RRDPRAGGSSLRADAAVANRRRRGRPVRALGMVYGVSMPGLTGDLLALLGEAMVVALLTAAGAVALTSQLRYAGMSVQSPSHKIIAQTVPIYVVITGIGLMLAHEGG